MGLADAAYAPIPVLCCPAGEELGAKFEYRDIPEDMQKQAQEYREKLYDQIVEQDDDVLAAYFEVCLPSYTPVLFHACTVTPQVCPLKLLVLICDQCFLQVGKGVCWKVV